jgi:hypothetical protein
VDSKIEETIASLDSYAADSSQRNAVLKPLQDLKVQLLASSSIPRIMFLQTRADELLDEAMDMIASAQAREQAAAAPKPVCEMPSTLSSSNPNPTAVAQAPQAKHKTDGCARNQAIRKANGSVPTRKHNLLYGRLPFAKQLCALPSRIGCSFISGLVAVDISLLAPMESADPHLICHAG